MEEKKAKNTWSSLLLALVIICFCCASFFLGFVFSRTYGKDIDFLKETIPSIISDEINREPTVIYPKDKYEWKDKVSISLYNNDKYFHVWLPIYCSFSIEKNPVVDKNILVVSSYEAIQRGFEPCPSCINNYKK